MATVKWTRFTHVEELKGARPQWLLRLLEPHAAYFKDRGLILDGKADPDYEKLATVLAVPHVDMPDDLIAALFFVHEMSNPEDIERLLEENGKRPPSERISFASLDNPTPMEFAIHVWLEDREFLEEKHAEQKIANRRSFETYPSFMPAPLPKVDSAALREIEREVDAWLIKMKREPNAKVFQLRHPDGIWFMVRHGLPFRREGAIRKGKSAAVYFQPEHYDVVVYDPDTGDLRVNAENAKAAALYRRAFGRCVFEDEDRFQDADRFTLDVLFERGEDCLACSDIPGIERITLKEVTWFSGGTYGLSDACRADDVFAAFKESGRTLPDNARLTSATFDVQYADAKTPRSFTIRLPRGTKFTRDEDGVALYAWMKKRGFLVEEADDDEAHDADADLAAASV